MGIPELTGIFPRAEPCADGPESELTVYRRLKGSLPPDWTAWHSLKIRTNAKSGTVLMTKRDGS